MTDKPYPRIFQKICAGRLVDPVVLEQVYNELYQNLTKLGQNEDPSILPGSPLISSKLQPTVSPPFEKVAGSSENDSFFEINSSDTFTLVENEETNFELGEAGSYSKEGKESDSETSDSSSIELATEDESGHQPLSFSDDTLEEEIERFLPAELELRGLINRWQVSQLLQSRSRFTLGHYRMIGSLGVGGYGQVFLARNENDPCNLSSPQCRHQHNNDVAVKVLPIKRANEKAIEKFKREIELSRLFQHKNIVRFIDSSMDGNVHYAVYEYLNGGDVRKLINRYERLDYETASGIISQVAEALAYLHELGIVHRDIKPGNILLKKDGSVHLLDFGLAVPYRSSEAFDAIFERNSNLSNDFGASETGPDPELNVHQENNKRRVAGTPDYLAPDQIRDPDNPSPLWDIYSLGCTFYFMITGIVPFPSGTARQKMQAQLYSEPPEPKMFDPQLPEPLSKLILKMMAKNPADRIQSATEVVSLLKNWTASPVKIASLLKNSNNGMANPPLTDRTINRFNENDFLAAVEEESDLVRSTPLQPGPVQNPKNGQNSSLSSQQSPTEQTVNESDLPPVNTETVEPSDSKPTALQDLLFPLDQEVGSKRSSADILEEIAAKKTERLTIQLTYFLLFPLLILGIILLALCLLAE